MNVDFTNLIITDCGKKYEIDIFDQLAVGVVECDSFLQDPYFIPSTFSLYKTKSDIYLLQITTFNEANDSLETSIKVLSEKEASNYLENCTYNI